MIVGVPKETKSDEYRVAMIPVGVEELTRCGHQVLIQAGAGQGSGIGDEQYSLCGAEIVSPPEEIWKRADLIVKVLAAGTLPDGRLYYAMEYVPGCDLEMVWRELSGSPGSASAITSHTEPSGSSRQRYLVT